MNNDHSSKSRWAAMMAMAAIAGAGFSFPAAPVRRLDGRQFTFRRPFFNPNAARDRELAQWNAAIDAKRTAKKAKH